MTPEQEAALIRQVTELQSECRRLRNQLDATQRHARRVMDTAELERKRADRLARQLAEMGF